MPPSSSSDLKIRYSPSTMGSYTTPTDSFTPSFFKFNSALTAGLLNPMSPPPLVNKSRSNPTVYEMMTNETDSHSRATILDQNDAVSKLSTKPPPQDNQELIQKRLMDVLALRSPNNQLDNVDSGDVKLKLSSKDGASVSISVHRKILMAHSRFFALKLKEKRVKQQRSLGPYILEIADCDDIEIYTETLRLIYCKDLRKKLMKEDVPRVLAILKTNHCTIGISMVHERQCGLLALSDVVSVAIGFDGGVLSCLEYLEAAPWAEDEEEKVASLIIGLRLEGIGATEVLKRGSLDTTPAVEDGNNNEQVLNSSDDCPNIRKGFEVWWRRVFWRQK
ncbi:hypothetical protein DH2020_036246 [Rehmannia glutinosa]|uniref:BTB domain-containing protein n=1 Tax=Rehmannia glutinosa TaxID=99300 RepID=A0ABR0V703_REHGL